MEVKNIYNKKLHYLVCINVKKYSGKELATFHKNASLRKFFHNYNLFSIKKKKGEFYNLVNYFFHELTYITKAIIGGDIPQIIISRCYYNFAPLIMKKIYGTYIYTEMHSDTVGEIEFLPINRIKKEILKLISKTGFQLIRSYDGIIFNNPILEKRLKVKYKLSQVRSIAVYNGAPKIVNKPVENRDTILNLINLPKDRIFLVFVGRISKWHGLENLIDIYPFLHSLNPKIDLLIIGDSTNKHYYKRLMERNNHPGIKFMGAMENSEVFKIFKIAIAGVIPVNDIRMSPGSPIKLYDMISADLPIITQKNTYGYSDVVLGNKLGIVIDFKCHKDSGHKIAEFVDCLLKGNFSHDNAYLAQTRLNWDNVIRKWAKFIGESIVLKKMDKKAIK